jgi:hypothetical protein
MNVKKMSKDEAIREIVRLYLTHPNLKPKEIQARLGLPKRAMFRYLDEIRERLHPVDDTIGASKYLPSEDEVEMSTLMLKRALEENQVTDDMIELAREVLERARSA